MSSPSPSSPPTFPGRLAVLQRVLPAYRVPFFDTLAAACQGGLSLAAGRPRAEESIATAERLEVARFVPARNLHFGSPASPAYLCWQGGLLPWLEHYTFPHEARFSDATYAADVAKFFLDELARNGVTTA